jgi:hypothetical protein
MKTSEKRNQKIELVKKLSEEFTQIISRIEIAKYPDIYWGSNGVGDRWCNKLFNYTSIRANKAGELKLKTYSEKDSDSIPPELLDAFKNDPNHKEVNGIVGIFVHSRRENIVTRPIRDDIKKFYRNIACVVCGSNSELVCDHKNDCYNDNDVLDSNLQQLDDFQSLCNHCNLQKRQIFRKECEDNKIYSAKNIPQFRYYSFDFPWEKKTFDRSDVSTKQDTFWYDPIEFHRKLELYTKLYYSVIIPLKTKTVTTNPNPEHPPLPPR